MDKVKIATIIVPFLVFDILYKWGEFLISGLAKVNYNFLFKQ